MENKYIREKFNGLTDEVYKWNFISIAPFLKKEIRSKTSEKEIIDAYLHSAECLCICFHQESNPIENMKMIRTNQMYMLFLFLCRHTLELLIKAVLNSQHEKVKKIHQLQELWNELKRHIEIDNADFDMLINVLNTIDDDGCKLRYADDEKVKIFLATSYNKYGEGNPWKQGRVLQYFSEDELLIGKDYWNFVCDDENGFDIVMEQYKKSAVYIKQMLIKVKEMYFNK